MFSQPVLGSRTSPYLQEKLVLLGCQNVFNSVPKVVESILGIPVNESQVYRICQSVSNQIDDKELDSPSEGLEVIENEREECVYGMVDGSMLPTDEGWQECKVGRVFKAEMIEHSDPYKWEMGQSDYVACRGHYSLFTEKFELLLPPTSLCQKVFITDGAVWIGNWLSRSYEKSTQILDFFHVTEKLAVAAKTTHSATEWLEKQKNRLLKGKWKKVYKAIEKLPFFEDEAKYKLLTYFKNNAYRMKYDEYRQRGLMISSGPIESAHRTVLQVRMKLSGQYWSEAGCDNMIKLRVAYRSEKFDIITNILKKSVA